MSDIDFLLKKFAGMKPKDYARVVEEANKATAGMRWIPSPGPQTQAYFCKADQMLYGGEPGGGKTALAVGLAFNCHRRSLLMRRKYTDLSGLTDYAIVVNGSRDGYNGSSPPRLRFAEDRFIDFGAAANVGDEQSWMGQPHDLIAFDETCQFAEAQVRFVIGWLRTEVPGQRTRVVFATNPPLSAEGLWIVQMFAPWLDPRHPHPARPGELRYFVVDSVGKDRWVDGPDPVNIDGKLMRPLSRTFIPSSVKDNPYYAGTGYERELENMSEPYRSMLMGGFRTSFRDQPNQAIPTKWVQMAQERWTPRPPDGIPMCAIGVDCSGGGEDPMVMAPRYDAYFCELIEVEGHEIPMDRSGAYCAGRLTAVRRDSALCVIDMGGGYGGPLYEHLKSNGVDCYAYKGAEASTKRTADRKLGFTNKRSAAYWCLREALDPAQPGGSPIALPLDSQLIADLTAPTFEVTPRGIQLEPKDKVRERLGRSTNRGDAVVMAWWQGARMITNAEEWIDRRASGGVQRPQVIHGRRQPMSAQRPSPRT